jgi:hypothetical protein
MESLRETISALVDKSEAGEPLTEIKETPVETPVATETTAETEEQKAGRTAGRQRDEKGRLLPGKVEKTEPLQTQPEVIRPPKPSSWKKEYDEHWGKLDPKVAEYINQRESEYAKGVSTYKQEWDQAKPFLDAIAPYYPDFQRIGMQPVEAITKLASTHREMVASNPMQRLQIFTKLANDYQVPLQALLDPQFAQAFAVQQQQPQQQTESPEAAARRVYSELRAQEGVVEFGSKKDSSGNPMYPHYEAVRTKMAQLLESGLATDLEGAYHAAVKLDDALFQSVQAEKAKAEEAQRLEAQRKAVSAAKSNAISVRSATPASTGAGAQKGLRSTIEAAFDEHTGGRV